MRRLRYIQGDLYDAISIVCLYFAALSSLLSDTANTIGLYIALPIAFVLSTLNNKGFHTTVYEKIIFLLYAWDYIAYLWADDKQLDSGELHKILGAFMLVYILPIIARREKRVPWLYGVYIILYLSAWNYAIHNILTVMANDWDRLNDDKLNANTLAYYTFYISFVTYMLSEISKAKTIRRIWQVAFWMMLPFSFLVSLLTASRQVILIQVPLYGLLIYIKYLKKVSAKRKILYCFFALIVGVALAGPIYNTYENSYLSERAEMDLNDDPRVELFFDASRVAMDNLPLGVGSANYEAVSSRRQFSHNSYLEAFVNMGIVGLVLYTSLMLVFVVRQWRRYRASGDKTYFAFFTFGLIYALDGIFFVFYNAIWLISFFLLVASHSETYFRSHGVSGEIGETAVSKELQVQGNN